MQARPLEGIRVVDYSHFLAGPYVGRCLAALGAEVIKVERPGTGDAGRQHATVLDDQQSGYFLQLNMGKRGVSVNMKDPRGKAFMQRLCDSADVFIENYRPGALDKLGLGYAELSARNPGLVYCSISAYGHTGPDAHRAGFGLIAEAKSGIMQMVGTPGERPPGWLVTTMGRRGLRERMGRAPAVGWLVKLIGLLHVVVKHGERPVGTLVQRSASTPVERARASS